MKLAVILHAYHQNSGGHWYPWLKSQLQAKGYTVWVPELPLKPNARETTKLLLSNRSWDFNGNLIIGHSMGAVQLLNLLQHLPEVQSVNTAVFVSAFTQALIPKFIWAEPLQGLFNETFDFSKIQLRAKSRLFLHGDDDPYCDPRDAKLLAAQTDAEFISVQGGQHFSSSIDPKYLELTKLIELLGERHLL